MAYTEADRNAHMREILNYLYHIAIRDLRIPIVTPSSEYSAETALAVRAYQQAYGLPVTGEINEATWNSIVMTYRLLTDQAIPLAVFPHSGFLMQQGDTGELVYLVQVLLNTLARRYHNLPVIPISGSYDMHTSDAVKRLQGLAALPENGVLDRATWDHLALFINQLTLTI
ncbi:MAG: peptidoglycan-binding domain-containing protein [Oscillospiraceae bacterium]|nr:peptidoglycan-binding domain-containing protein [Oscillospiraceae bacterium]